MRNFETKIDNTYPSSTGALSAAEDNCRSSEMMNAVTTAGIALDDGSDTDLRMMAQAMARYASAGIFCQDSGVANSYVLNLTSLFEPPSAYFTGLRVLFYPSKTSTGASTIRVFGLGSVKLLRADGSAIQAGDIYSNRLTDAFFDHAADGGTGAFRLAPWSLPPALLSPLAIPLAGEGITLDGTYHISLNFPGLTAAIPVSADVFAFFSQTQHHHRTITLAGLISLIQSSVTSLSSTQIAPVFKAEERRANLVKRALPGAKTWFRRPVSDVVINEISGASLNGSNQIILPAGSYRGEFAGVTAHTENHRTRIFNVTTQQMLGQGCDTDSYTASNSPSTASLGSTWFQLDNTSTIELQGWAYASSPSGASLGDSEPNDIGGGNYYVDGYVTFTKES